MKQNEEIFSWESWVTIPTNSDFSLQNLPYCIFSTPNNEVKKIGVGIGEYVIDLNQMQQLNAFDTFNLSENFFLKDYLNDFIGLGKQITNAIREKIMIALKKENGTENNILFHHQKSILLPQKNLKFHLPVKIGDYTDFYSSREHATNVGTMFRDPNNALLPNWLHLPVAYHGRASSIVVSGTDIIRPYGQTKAADAEKPSFHATKLLDFELEMGFIIGKNTKLGENITTAEAENHIFGMVLFNDWSARDIQAWEYVPLGPFLAKNFASAMSPWVVVMEALEYFKVETPAQSEVLDYLKFEGKKSFDIQLEVFIKPQNSEEKLVCKSNHKYLYWNISQQLAHHTINGCNMNIGDLCASGTISGSTPDSFGSMLELTWRGSKPILMHDNTERKFINDFDTVIMRGFCEKNGHRVGFGEVNNFVLPAK
ncbi:MAG: fumarylacetoacetase [Bacteroidetes bacterium]|nr:MAG: fumarylacetoacetase [Bacteroidota bacterium]TAG95494.1 MAG: fumarylacetoacetase [Bacteroidota bacterium]